MKEHTEFTRLKPSAQMIAEADCAGDCDNCEGVEICWSKDAKKITNMKTEIEQIEEMAKELSPYGFCKIKECKNCVRKKCGKCNYYSFAKRYVLKGYRKASDVIDEFVNRIKQDCFDFGKDSFIDWTDAMCEVSIEDIERIAAEMRKRIEK